MTCSHTLIVFVPLIDISNCKSSNINSTLPQGNLDVLQINHSFILSSGDMSCRPWVEIIYMKMFAKTMGAHITVNRRNLRQVETFLVV